MKSVISAENYTGWLFLLMYRENVFRETSASLFDFYCVYEYILFMQRIDINNHCSRYLAERLEYLVRNHSIIVLTSPRQTGKSSFLYRVLAGSWRYVTLADFDVLMQMRNDPEFYLKDGKPTIIDEAQKFPEILTVVKNLVDANQERKFIMSGTPELMMTVKNDESMTGKAVYLEIDPLNYGEIKNLARPRLLDTVLHGNTDLSGTKVNLDSSITYSIEDFVWRGGMPAMLRKNDPLAIVDWRESYLETCVNNDLTRLSRIEDPTRLRMFMRGVARENGGLVNINKLSGEIGLAQPTAHRYLNLLESGMLVKRIPAYPVTKGLRVYKKSKTVWCDSGIAAHAAGFFSAEELQKSEYWDGFFKAYVINQLLALSKLLVPIPKVYYWRTRKLENVDLLMEQHGKLLAFQIVNTRNIKLRDTFHIQEFLKHYPETTLGIVIYNGLIVKKFSENLYAIPLSGIFTE